MGGGAVVEGRRKGERKGIEGVEWEAMRSGGQKGEKGWNQRAW